MKVAGYCYDCQGGIRNPAEHRSTAKHRKALYARASDTVGLESDGAAFARRMRQAHTVDEGTPEQRSIAAAKLGGCQTRRLLRHGYRAGRSDGAETWMPEPVPIRQMKGLDPCPRCGRNDWRSKRGREYHVNENPDCQRWRKPERHVYAMA